VNLWQPEHKTTKLTILGGVITLTLAIHYGFIIEPIFGDQHWVHAIHGRFCYIPIVIAAAWFGVRGGLAVAAIISLAVLPLIFGSDLSQHNFAGEMAEIVFYFAIAILAGALFGRELRARQRAEEMRLQLERSHKLSLVGQIAAGMAHEIKNPLASIKGAVEIVGDENIAPAEREEFRGIIFKEIKRVNNSLTDFLEFARPSETKFAQVNLAEIVNASLKQVQAQAAKRGITVSGRVVERVPVRADQEKLHQVLLNLLINAIEASGEDGEVRVVLDLEKSAGNARVLIEDEGSGIEKSSINKIFEPFFTTKSSGTGLGLAIARNIIELHGGKLDISNRTEGGVCARLLLPLASEDDPA
jgi:signal transduction histidine kinase